MENNFICKYCEDTFYSFSDKRKASHIGNCKSNPNKQKSIEIVKIKNKEISRLRILEKKKKYYKDCKFCKKCNKRIMYDNRFNIFCNHSCSAKFTNPLKSYDNGGRKRVCSKIAIDNIRNGVKKRFSGSSNEIIPHKCFKEDCKILTKNKKYCSNGCRNKCPINSKLSSDRIKKRFDEYPETHPNRICAGRMSYPEKSFMDYLIKEGLEKEKDFFQQKKVNRYHVDFYFPLINLVIEIDGKRWHTNKELEKKREDYIKIYHKIIRFDTIDLMKGKFNNKINYLIKIIKRLR